MVVWAELMQAGNPTLAARHGSVDINEKENQSQK